MHKDWQVAVHKYVGVVKYMKRLAFFINVAIIKLNIGFL